MRGPAAASGLRERAGSRMRERERERERETERNVRNPMGNPLLTICMFVFLSLTVQLAITLLAYSHLTCMFLICVIFQVHKVHMVNNVHHNSIIYWTELQQ